MALQATVLDLAAGTLDVSLEIVRQRPSSLVIAADFSLPMLRQGQRKINLGRRLPARFCRWRRTPIALPFPEAEFDAVTIAFGIRNLPDRLAALGKCTGCCGPRET